MEIQTRNNIVKLGKKHTVMKIGIQKAVKKQAITAVHPFLMLNPYLQWNTVVFVCLGLFVGFFIEYMVLEVKQKIVQLPEIFLLKDAVNIK